ncbi:MAG: hypothetical protein NTU88_00950, partial [Armatimonadetes bacterium]|nr:hypothetical protein [Armatimonadota bacterium]
MKFYSRAVLAVLILCALACPSAPTWAYQHIRATPHFNINYDSTGTNAVSEHFVDTLEDVAEFAWDTIAAWGYRLPPSGQKVEVAQQGNDRSLYWCWPLHLSPSSIVVDPDQYNMSTQTPDESMMLVKFGHEFCHACQDQYICVGSVRANNNQWIADGSAQWMVYELLRAKYPTGRNAGLDHWASDLQNALDRRDEDLWRTNDGYDAVYFWYFVARNLHYDYSGSGQSWRVDRKLWEELSSLTWQWAGVAVERALAPGPTPVNTYRTAFEACARAYTAPRTSTAPWFDDPLWDQVHYSTGFVLFADSDVPVEWHSSPNFPISGQSCNGVWLQCTTPISVKASFDGDDGKDFFVKCFVCSGASENTYLSDPAGASRDERDFQLARPSNTGSQDHIQLSCGDSLFVVVGKHDDGSANYTIRLERATDNIPPQVTKRSYWPTKEGNIILDFSEDIDSSSFTNDTITVVGSVSHTHTWQPTW